MSNVSSPTPVTGNPLEAWGDMTTYWYIDSQKTTQGPFNLAQMIMLFDFPPSTPRRLLACVTYQYWGGIRE